MRFADLDRAARQQLTTLSKDNATSVAGHLVMVARLLDVDLELAQEHAVTAVRRAGRVAAVREARGMVAYRVGDFQLALAEFRTARRLGATGLLALIVDSERGLGRTERALELASGPDARGLTPAERIELDIVVSGIRRDLGQADAAVLALRGPELDPTRRAPWSARLFYAYGEALAAAGREDEARTWFAHAVEADDALDTDAAERLDEIDGVVTIDLLEGSDEDADEEHEDGRDGDSVEDRGRDGHGPHDQDDSGHHQGEDRRDDQSRGHHDGAGRRHDVGDSDVAGGRRSPGDVAREDLPSAEVPVHYRSQDLFRSQEQSQAHGRPSGAVPVAGSDHSTPADAPSDETDDATDDPSSGPSDEGASAEHDAAADDGPGDAAAEDRSRPRDGDEAPDAEAAETAGNEAEHGDGRGEEAGDDGARAAEAAVAPEVAAVAQEPTAQDDGRGAGPEDGRTA